MKDIINEMIMYRETNEEEYFENFIECIIPLIKSRIKKIPWEYREDVKQELLLKALIVCKSANIMSDIIINRDFFILTNLKIAEKIAYDKRLNEIFALTSLYEFIQEGNNILLFLNAFIDISNFIIFEDAYRKFVASKKILSLLMKKFDSTVSDFYRFYNKEIKNEINLNHRNKISNDFSDNYCDRKEKTINLNEFSIEILDMEFIELFIENGNLLTQKEVANKIGQTQQMVSKKYRKIIKKYNKFSK